MRFSDSLESFFPGDVSVSERRFFITVTFLFITAVVAGCALGVFWLILLPFAIILLYYLLEEIDAVLVLVVLLVPFSLETIIPGTGSAMQIPSEPLLLILLTVWALQAVFKPSSYDRLVDDTRRITTALVLFVGTLFISVITSSNPFVSVKLFLNTSWYLAGCYFFLIRRCRSLHRIETIIRAFFLGTIVAVVYAVGRHSLSGFSLLEVNESMRPLFAEHGSYAAHLSVVLGIAIGLSFETGNHHGLRLFAIVVSILLFIGVVFSYTRAAWLSVGVMLLFFLVIRAKELFRFRSFLIITIVAALITVIGINLGIQSTMERTATSIIDVERNLSNLERFNRWVAALNMIKANPVKGVGYGTYPIMYEKYKDRRFLTPVSDFYGGPHNDFLQYFAEAGIFGLLTWLFFLYTLFRLGLKNYFRIKDLFQRNLLLGCLGGVLTYLVHALFNDFLQYDKVAIPFWIAIGLIVLIIDMSQKQNHVLNI